MQKFQRSNLQYTSKEQVGDPKQDLGHLGWLARPRQFTIAKLSLPIHCHQVVAGQLKTANLPWGQLTVGSQSVDRQSTEWWQQQLQPRIA